MRRKLSGRDYQFGRNRLRTDGFGQIGIAFYGNDRTDTVVAEAISTKVQMDRVQDSQIEISRKTIVVLANVDLFSESLIHAIRSKFVDYNIIVHDKPVPPLISEQVNVDLILIYRILPNDLTRMLRGLRRLFPEAAIGLVVKHADEFGASIKGIVAEQLIRGVLPLSLRLDVCLAAVELLIKGGEHFPSALLGRLAPGSTTDKRSSRTASRIAIVEPRLASLRMAGLTMREEQIFDLICTGTANKVIAWTLNLSENTVKVHIRNIFRKLKVRNRTEATSRYFSVEDF